jgi:hypothetical protein
MNFRLGGLNDTLTETLIVKARLVSTANRDVGISRISSRFDPVHSKCCSDALPRS